MLEKITTTWLELTVNDSINFKEGFTEKMEVRQVANDAWFNFILFAGVGLPWRWYSRLGWTLSEWEDYFSKHVIRTYLAFSGNSITGYYELLTDGKSDTEIKFIGLLPAFKGKGLGGMLLSHAIKSAIDEGSSRVWLHTCTNDSETALANYLSRGFRIFREEEKTEYVPGKEELIRMVSGFFERYYDFYSGNGR